MFVPAKACQVLPPCNEDDPDEDGDEDDRNCDDGGENEDNRDVDCDDSDCDEGGHQNFT